VPPWLQGVKMLTLSNTAKRIRELTDIDENLILRKRLYQQRKKWKEQPKKRREDV
jgi:hypothetical protein